VLLAPSKYLERTRGQILSPSEDVKLASSVQAIGSTSSRYSHLRIPIRVRAFLALTDQRLLLVSQNLRANKARILFEWPSGELKFSTTRRKVGASLIHVGLPGGGRIDFGHFDGQSGHDWANLHFRRS